MKMAKKKATTKKPASKPKADKPEADKPEIASNDKVKEIIKKYAKGWGGWKGLTTWEKKSKISKEKWRKGIMKYTFHVIDKMIEKKPKIYDNLSQDDCYVLLESCKRLVHNKEYIKIAKPEYITSSKKKFYFYALQDSRYFDWGNPRYVDALESYTKASKDNKNSMIASKEVIIKYDSSGRISKITPTMKWGTGSRAIPEHAWVGNICGAAMPIEDYEQAMKEGDESECWNNLLPCVIDLNSDVPRDVHFGDPRSDKYIEMFAGKCYIGEFSIQKGKKLTTPKPDEKGYYQYEGLIDVQTIEDPETGKEKKITLYSGQRSYQYNIVPTKDCSLKEVDFKTFGVENSDSYFINDVIFQTWSSILNVLSEEEIEQNEKEGIIDNELRGLAYIPTFFEDMQNLPDKRGRISTLHPVAFTADIVDATISTPTDAQKEDPSWKPLKRMRLDDQLDEKMGEESDFVDLTLLCNDLSSELQEEFKKLARGTIVRVVANLSKKDKDSFISGSCLWFDIVKSTAVKEGLIDSAILEEDDEEFSILDEDED